MEIKIVGWMVGWSDEEPAMYNVAQGEEAFDASRRWNRPISALVVHPDAPEWQPVSAGSSGNGDA